jgi:hypothetical protein
MFNREAVNSTKRHPETSVSFICHHHLKLLLMLHRFLSGRQGLELVLLMWAFSCLVHAFIDAALSAAVLLTSRQPGTVLL